MPFGKRKTPPPSKLVQATSTVVGAGFAPASDERKQRLGALREAMDRCLTQTAELAGLVERMDMLDTDRFGPHWRRDQYPIEITDLGELFASGTGGTQPVRAHALYAYSYPLTEDEPDRDAQAHLLDLTTMIIKINSMCFAAHRDGVLGVVLQSPAMREQIDGAIVGAAFFSAFFEGMAMLADGQPAGDVDQPAIDALHGVLARRLAIARSAMLAASRLDALVPNRRWPFVGVEIAYPPHTGERTINEVYFPQDLAARMERKAESTALPLAAVDEG